MKAPAVAGAKLRDAIDRMQVQITAAMKAPAVAGAKETGEVGNLAAMSRPQ